MPPKKEEVNRGSSNSSRECGTDETIKDLLRQIGAELPQSVEELGPIIAQIVSAALRSQSESSSSQAKLTPLKEPDSMRMDELLPSYEHRLHCVKEEQAMLRLLSIHLEMFAWCSGPDAWSGSEIPVPLMDSLYGMGRTSFATKYLAMVERFVLTTRDEVLKDLREGGGSQTDHEVLCRIRDTVDQFSPYAPRGKSGDPKLFLQPMLEKLHNARTIYIDCRKLNLLDDASRDAKLIQALRDAHSFHSRGKPFCHCWSFLGCTLFFAGELSF